LLSFKKNSNFKTGIFGIIAGLVLLCAGSAISIYSHTIMQSLPVHSLGRISVPGETNIDTLPDGIPEDKPISFLLDTQIVSSHAKIRRNPLLKNFQYQFTIPLQVTYHYKDNTEEEKQILFSSDNPFSIASIESIIIHGQEYMRFPLFSIPAFNTLDSIRLTFEEDESNISTFFESELYVREAPVSLLLGFLLPFLTICLAIILFQVGLGYLLVAFFHRNLNEGEKSYPAALLFSLTLGLFGIDRFYLGYPIQGILKGATFGGLGFWYVYDLFQITAGRLKDANGNELKGSGL
jgi:hypothetical protein